MLNLHRSERADVLVDALGDLLVTPLSDPLAPEIVAVPTRGVERWLTQRLSHRLGTSGSGEDGVCAHIDFSSPRNLLREVVAVAYGADPEADPWRPERSVWPIIDLIDRRGEDPALALLQAHLRAATPLDRRGELQPVRRFAVARHLSELFERYSLHRPDMVRGWAGHGADDVPVTDETYAWQAHLWRILRAEIGSPSPAERVVDAARRLIDEPGVSDLPERLSIFGLTRLPASYLEVLTALACHRDVHLWLLHPSRVLWEKVDGERKRATRGLRRVDDPTARVAAHPLLRSWGRDSREMQLVLASYGAAGGNHREVPDGEGSLLTRIQTAIRLDAPPPGPPCAGAPDLRVEVDPDDRSIQIHACHGKGRQVEVMRDALLHLLDSDPTLEPRDVIVMCPDIDTFAPMIDAAFSLDRADRGTSDSATPQLRARLADRSVRQTNPLLAVADELLALAGSRVTASQVMDLATRAPVARRFRFAAGDLALLQRWLPATGIRWGIDANDREPWALHKLSQGTWEAGLDRLLLGVAMAEEDGRMLSGVLPFDDVSSSEVELAGRLAELVSRLKRAVDRLRGLKPVATWVEALVESTESLAVADPSEAWQHEQLWRVLSSPAREAAGCKAQLCLAEIRDLLGSRLEGRPTRANFRTGDLTFCTMVPMRSVPHRVVGLLGLDDSVFPRHPERDGDDLLIGDPYVGDSDPRSEDRQLLLDALLSATENLVIAYSGKDERTNRVRPPAVPISELLDVIDATTRPDSEGNPARSYVVTEHPLQPFDSRNFVVGALIPASAWSHDRVQLAGSLASVSQSPARGWPDGRLRPLADNVVQLDDLVAFVEHPVRAFLRQRLGMYLRRGNDALDDDIPIELEPLAKWAVGDRMLRAALDGLGTERAAALERARGLLPPGDLASPTLDEVRTEVEALLAAAVAVGGGTGPADSLDVHLELGDGRTLIGTVPGFRAATVLACTYSRLGPKHRIASWVRFLALSIARPELAVSAVTIGRGGRRAPQVSTFEPVAHDEAQNLLEAVVDLYDRGMREPLPLACATSEAWASARHRGGSRDEAYREAERVWKAESSDIEHGEVWNARADFDVLYQPELRADETTSGWPGTEKSRFASFAGRLWTPVLDHERLSNG